MRQLEGWIKLHRKVFDNPVICKDAETISIWIYLLLSATHKEIPMVFAGEKTTLKPGQLITGRKKISDKLAVTESKVQRTLKRFEDEQQIEQRMSNGNRLITIISWELYQGTEQQVEQPMNNQRTTSEQPVNTNKNERIKEVKKDNKYTGSFEEFWSAYPRKKDKGNAFKKYNARLNSGFSEVELLGAAKAYTDECNINHTDEQYIKHPSTFLGDATPFVEYLKKGVRDNEPGRCTEPDTGGLIQQAVAAGIGDGEWEGF